MRGTSVFLNLKVHLILIKEIMIFFSQCIIKDLRTCVYWWELFLKWAMWPTGLLLCSPSCIYWYNRWGKYIDLTQVLIYLSSLPALIQTIPDPPVVTVQHLSPDTVHWESFVQVTKAPLLPEAGTVSGHSTIQNKMLLIDQFIMCSFWTYLLALEIISQLWHVLIWSTFVFPFRQYLP